MRVAHLAPSRASGDLEHGLGRVAHAMEASLAQAAAERVHGQSAVDRDATVFGADANRDVLVRQGGLNGMPSPNAGQLTTIGPLGANTSNDVGLDISGLTGTAYASLTTRLGPLDTSSDLYTIDLLTGAATLVGSIGQPAGLGAIITQDIAAPIGLAVPEPRAYALFVLSMMTMLNRRGEQLRRECRANRS